MDPKYFYLPRGFELPRNYQPPANIHTDLHQPQYNSWSFRETCSLAGSNLPFQPLFTSVAQNDEGLIILATNAVNTATLRSSIVGAEKFQTIADCDEENLKFKIPGEGWISHLDFLNDQKLFIAAKMSQEVCLFSTNTALRSSDPNMPMQISHIWSTDGYVTTIGKMRSKHSLIAGTSKGGFHVLDYGRADLAKISHYEGAHVNEISSISCKAESEKMWASCSTDSLLLWDLSKLSPALGILKDYEHQLTAVHWIPGTDKLLVGDEVGNILLVDLRSPQDIQYKIKLSHRGICKFIPRGSNEVVVLARSNVANVEVTKDGFKTKHQHVARDFIIYDAANNHSDGDTMFFVGEEKYAEAVKMK